MGDNLNTQQPKDRKFVQRWAAIRARGRVLYVITRGIGFGSLLFAVWLTLTLIDINSSQFKQALHDENSGMLLEKSLLWFGCYAVLGGVFANSRWKRQEDRYNYLT